MSRESARPHVIIIGASSGLGAACAQRFSSYCNVTGISRRGTFPGEMPLDGSHSIACDATSSEALRAAVEQAVERFGKASLVIVASGLQSIKPIRNTKESDVLDLLKTNLAVPLYAASLFASQRFSNADAVLCLISSISSIRSEPGIVLYGATKAATNSLVSGLAKELAPRRVVGVSPGWMETPMTQAYSHIYTPDFVEALKARTPLEIASVEDVVDAIEFLSSPKGRKITGQVLVVDGGASL